MEDFKEFQGKDLDDCISQACAFYDLPREKMEIELIQDAKSGIFGIVGARKAKIKARRAAIAESVQTYLDSPAEGSKVESEASPKKADRNRPFRKAPRPDAPHKKYETDTRVKKEAENFSADEFDNDQGDSQPDSERFSFPDNLDLASLEQEAKEVARNLLRPIANTELNLEVSLAHGQIRIMVPWEGDAGLLIGRDGQTLAAIQYMASRILSKKMNANLKVQLDIGNYRSNQEDKLCALARNLAEKALQQGRSFSTRPLSSYHRRIIHLCLQENANIQTRSSGDGPLKRVLVYPKKSAGRS